MDGTTRRAGKLALWVTCRACGVPFDTRLRLDRASFERGTLAANYHACPRCGIRETYRKADHEPREAPPPGAPSAQASVPPAKNGTVPRPRREG